MLLWPLRSHVRVGCLEPLDKLPFSSFGTRIGLVRNQGCPLGGPHRHSKDYCGSMLGPLHVFGTHIQSRFWLQVPEPSTSLRVCRAPSTDSIYELPVFPTELAGIAYKTMNDPSIIPYHPPCIPSLLRLSPDSEPYSNLNFIFFSTPL